ncbi:DUF924 family protein [Litorivivens sp.]|uniref:DUF924 family protein n=1 Tax=Litorivivens sp. TaxID=2020868 RepID=UPI003566C82D
MMDLVDDWQYVLNFWFGDATDDGDVAAEYSDLWWGKSDDSDHLIWAKFSHRVEQASSGALTHWLDVPEGRLAAIILIDQFRRNIYRDKPEAFAEDSLARRWCREGLSDSVDQLLRPIERVFFYLPLEHSESMDDQEESVRRYRDLVDCAPKAHRELFTNYLNFAQRHYDIIARFGRFPHRNAILGRESSPEEIEFLKRPGSSF